MLLLLLVACSIAPVDEARDLLPLAPPTALLADDIGGWPLAAKAAPLSLGTTDGAALELTNLVGRAVVEEPLAWTELHLTYANSEARQREGRFTIRLPEGADITRLAMKVGGDWQEGEVVERKAAQRIFEDFLHRRQDPALLEQAAGSEFSARVFPIQPRGSVEIIVAYATALREGGQWSLPLKGLPPLRNVDVSAQVLRGTSGDGAVRQVDTLRLQKMDWVPDQDLTAPGPVAAGPKTLRSGDLLVARVEPPIEAPAAPIHSLRILVDSSASRALDYAADAARIGVLAQALARGTGADTPLSVVAFDQGLTPLFEGRAGDFGPADQARLAARLPMGASDLAGALGQLGGSARYERLLLLTDGVATAGETALPALRSAVAALASQGVRRLDVLQSGGLREASVLAGLVTAGLPEDGVVIDATAPASAVARRLERATRSALKVEVPGAAWVWPETLDGAQPGEPVLIFAQLDAKTAPALTIGGQPVALGPTIEGSAPLVERASAAARVRRLSALADTTYAKDPDTAAALRQQAIRLSLEQRVLSPWTALLVLESWWDYQRYGIDPANLARVVTVGPAGLEVLDRRGTNVALEELGYLPNTASRAGPQGGGEARATREVLPDAERSEDKPTMPLQAAPASRPAASAPAAEPKADFADNKESQKPAEEQPPADEGLRGAVAEKDNADTPTLGDLAAGTDPSLPMATSEAAGFGGLGTKGVGASGGGGLVGGSGKAAEAAPPPPPATPAVGRSLTIEPPAKTTTAPKKKAPPPPPRAAPWSGPYADIENLLASGSSASALRLALDWRAQAPGEVLAYLALADAFAATGNLDEAARAAGSLIDLYPSRADLRRAAGDKLAALHALRLARDTYAKAAAQRPDHPTSLRALAWAAAAAGDPQAAFDAILAAQHQPYRWTQEPGLRPVIREDAEILGAALIAARPSTRPAVEAALAQEGLRPATAPSLRFVLTWETDANDVDLHLTDRGGETAYFGHKSLRSGGELFRGVFDGYGPECFTINGLAGGFPYTLAAHYYRKGPMGYGLGRVQILHHDGSGNIGVEERPFVIMADDAWVDLGTLRNLPPLLKNADL